MAQMPERAGFPYLAWLLSYWKLQTVTGSNIQPGRETMRLIITLFTGVLLAGAGIASAGEMKMRGHDHQMQGMQQMKGTDSSTVKLRDEGTQKTCPVTGDPIDKNIFVDYQGKRIYFCCNSCPPIFNKDPQKYLKKLSDNGEKPALLALVPQKTCPVMGGAIDKNIYVDYKGQRIYFCCNGCPAQFKKDPEKYLKKLEAMGEKPEKL